MKVIQEDETLIIIGDGKPNPKTGLPVSGNLLDCEWFSESELGQEILAHMRQEKNKEADHE